MGSFNPDLKNSTEETRKQVLITIDVEDWFQVENFKNVIPYSSWQTFELRVEENTHRLLDLFDSTPLTHSPKTSSSGGKSYPPSVRATFFVLGWLAERLPRLVREIHERGHEVASHGYSHVLCSQYTSKQLARDLDISKKLLEDIIGAPVNGYRAPSFSANEDLLRIVEGCGFRYDSSCNSFRANKRYGEVDLSRFPKLGIAHRIGKNLYEIPISNLRVLGFTMPFGGGAYFRLSPLPVFLRAVSSIVETQGAYVFYLHPWEIDPRQPRAHQASLLAKFRHYTNLHSTYQKLSQFLNHLNALNFVSCSQYVAENAQGAA